MNYVSDSNRFCCRICLQYRFCFRSATDSVADLKSRTESVAVKKNCKHAPVVNQWSCAPATVAKELNPQWDKEILMQEDHLSPPQSEISWERALVLLLHGASHLCFVNPQTNDNTVDLLLQILDMLFVANFKFLLLQNLCCKFLCCKFFCCKF